MTGARPSGESGVSWGGSGDAVKGSPSRPQELFFTDRLVPVPQAGTRERVKGGALGWGAWTGRAGAVTSMTRLELGSGAEAAGNRGLHRAGSSLGCWWWEQDPAPRGPGPYDRRPLPHLVQGGPLSLPPSPRPRLSSHLPWGLGLGASWNHGVEARPSPRAAGHEPLLLPDSILLPRCPSPWPTGCIPAPLGCSMRSGAPPTQAWLLHLLGQPAAVSLSAVDIQG